MSVKSSPLIVLEPPPELEKWESEDEFEARLNRIQSKVPTETEGSTTGEPDSEDIARLKAENAQLRQLGEQARRHIHQLEDEAQKVIKRDADIEKMLEEKSEHICKLEESLAKLQAKQSNGVSEEELIALHAELERERQTLDEDRGSMEEQFRQLELSMARERAEIARERNEMQRTRAEMKLKLEMIEKNTKTEISPLRRLREELQGGNPAVLAPVSNTPGHSPQPGLPAMPQMPAINRRAPEGEETPKRSGILSRFLGKRDEQ